MIKQKINVQALYAVNIKNTFFSGYINPKKASYPAAPFVWLAHTLLLPLSLTFGAGTKTLIDVKTRRELSLYDLQNVKSHIEKLGIFSFNHVVDQIMKYKPKSEGSNALKKKLEEARKNAESKIEAFRVDEQERIKPNAQYQLNASELQEIEKNLEQYRKTIVVEKRKAQEEAILNYINDTINAGTRMENIIKNSVETTFRMAK